MMKRIVSLFLAGLMLLAAAACVAKRQDAQTEVPTAAPVNTETPTETPTEAPTVTDAPNAALQFVEAATVEEFLAAIASNTEIVLTGDVYDLQTVTKENGVLELCNLEQLHITGSGNTVLLHAAILAEFCTGFVLSGVTVCGDAEDLLALQKCSASRIDGCSFQNGDGYWSPNGISIQNCDGILISDCSAQGCVMAMYAMSSSEIRFSNCDIHDCATAIWLSASSDVLADGCKLHDCWQYEEPGPDEPEDDASFWIELDSGSTDVRFSNCEVYGNSCTFLFGTESIGEAVFESLNVHDNEADCFFSLLALNADITGRISIVNCDVTDNRIGTFFYANTELSKGELFLSGTSIRGNRIERLFWDGDVTVTGCEFTDNTVDHWIYIDEEFNPDARAFVHDVDGNELGEAELAAMTLAR
ncbi:MAG: right-handed parallel beta-helix repeat-containing protein [Clostridia bacterium]|nr:right-handed parallel beta-helix repeat-containing protein [Clostridia bacterium]